MATISGFPEVAPGVQFDKPVLFVAGERSSYLAPQQEPVVRRLFPKAQVTVIDGAGHWVHAEKPEEFLAVARAGAGRGVGRPLATVGAEIALRRPMSSPPGRGH